MTYFQPNFKERRVLNHCSNWTINFFFKYTIKNLFNSIYSLFQTISDLSPLNTMKHLLFLDASHNKLKNVMDFSAPHNLMEANFSFNEIEEICDLSQHRCLTKLNLSSILFYIFDGWELHTQNFTFYVL